MAYRNKSKYTSYQNKRKYVNKLEPGMTGFLCTCNSKLKEKDCTRESYNLLNEFADKLFPQVEPEKEKESEEVKQDAEDDIDSCLAKEVESIKAEVNKTPETRRFQSVESGANGIVFISSSVPDPVKLAHNIVTTISNTGQKSKFLLRLLPVEVTCKAFMDEISTACDKLFDKYFTEGEKTFCIVYNHRNNNSLNRDELIESIANLVTKKNVKNKADLKQADLTVLIEVIRNICCISVVPDYFKLKKYNLLELCGKPDQEETGAEGVAEKKNKTVEENVEEKSDELQNEECGDTEDKEGK